MSVTARWILGVCIGVLAGCAHLAPEERVVLPDGRQVTSAAIPADSRPAPRSLLLSSPDLEFRVASAKAGPYEVTYLVHRGALHGAIVEEPGGKRRHVHWVRRGGPDDVVALEYLYGMTLASDAEIEYSMDGVVQSHSDLLRALAQLRKRAAERVQLYGRAVAPWTMVVLQPHFHRDHERASVRIVDERGPLSGMKVSFGRAPHSGCEAESDEHGVASCELVDLHGHDGHDDHAEPIVATFVGSVAPGRVMPPTTLTIPGHNADNPGHNAPVSVRRDVSSRIDR